MLGLDLLVDADDPGLVDVVVLEHVVAGAVQHRNEQALVRIVGVDQHRHPHLGELALGGAITVQIVGVGRIDLDAVVLFRFGIAHRRNPRSVSVSISSVCCRP